MSLIGSNCKYFEFSGQLILTYNYNIKERGKKKNTKGIKGALWGWK